MRHMCDDRGADARAWQRGCASCLQRSSASTELHGFLDRPQLGSNGSLARRASGGGGGACVSRCGSQHFHQQQLRLRRDAHSLEAQRDEGSHTHQSTTGPGSRQSTVGPSSNRPAIQSQPRQSAPFFSPRRDQKEGAAAAAAALLRITPPSVCARLPAGRKSAGASCAHRRLKQTPSRAPRGGPFRHGEAARHHPPAQEHGSALRSCEVPSDLFSPDL